MKEIEYIELKHKMELHEKWLKHENGGNRLVISNTDLSNMNLEGMNFRMGVAIGADFRGANLKHCNFEGAVLINSNLSYANIEGANFSGAQLDGAIKVGINIGIGNNTEIRTIASMLDESECNDSKEVKREEITEDDMKAIEGVAIDKMLDDLEFEDLEDDE